MNTSIVKGRLRLLHHECRWLLSLRWLAGSAVLVLGVVDWAARDAGSHSGLVMAVGAFILLYNATLIACLRIRPSITDDYHALLNFSTIQLALDLLCLVLLTIWTGGVASPVLFAFLPHMLFASLLQPFSRALSLAWGVIAGVLAAIWLTGQWPAHSRELVTLLGWTAAVLLTVYLTDRVTHTLYRREEARVQQMERNEEIWAKLVAQQATMVQAEKMAVMGQMVAGIAHEITNPLASMDSVLQLMQRNPSVPRPASVNTLRQQIERILQIMRQFTSFSHPGHGAAQAVHVSQVIRSSLEMLAFNRDMKRVELVTHLEDDATLWINPHAMQQVITNIVVNALDAVASVPNPRITISTSQQPEVCVIEITDNGCGIPPEHLPRIFESFFTTKPVGKGTGLGLAICARLVREQGGRIEVRSTPGAGTTFTITLDRLTGEIAGQSAQQASNAGPSPQTVPATPSAVASQT